MKHEDFEKIRIGIEEKTRYQDQLNGKVGGVMIYGGVNMSKLTLPEAMVEIDRLKQQIRYQDQRDGRIGTHSPTCYTFGPSHYECALRKIEDLESER
jgi:hypothetical protein